MSSPLADLDRDDLDALADWLDERRKRKTERQAQQELRDRIDGLAGQRLSDEDVERIAAAVNRQSDGPDGTQPGTSGEGPGSGGGSSDPDDSPGPDPKPGRKRYRPGRRSGNAYDFDVDDKGQVVRLDVARIYQGEDEPDRVELPGDDGGDGGDDA